MTNVQELFSQQPTITGAWPAATRALYQTFTDHLGRDTPVTIKVGKGGLSYYAATGQGRLFVCHFNAQPRGAVPDVGFADFRQDVLLPFLDVPTMRSELQAALGGPEINVGAIWCSFRFPLAHSAAVADALRTHLLAKLPLIGPAGRGA
jgi:hypothetical protein